MNKLLFFTISALFASGIFAQSECNISDYYGDFLKVEILKRGEREFLGKSVKIIENQSCVQDLVNNNILYIDYLLTHFISREKYSELHTISDSMQLKQDFVNILKKDSLFNSLMTELADKTVNKSSDKDSVNIDDLVNIAVKYFAILDINDEGHFSTRICTGFNLIKETEIDRNPHLEAFAFSSIMKNLSSEEYNLYHDFVNAVRKIYKLNLGTGKEDILLRAQGALFMFMAENSKLEKMLKDEYNKQKDHLPFILYF